MLVTSYISLLTDFEDDIRNWWSPGSHLGHVPAWTWQMFAAAKCTTAASSHSPPGFLWTAASAMLRSSLLVLMSV